MATVKQKRKSRHTKSKKYAGDYLVELKGEDTAEAYKYMIKQDTLSIEEAFCVLYPESPYAFGAALHGDCGKMQSLVNDISIAVKLKKLRTEKINGTIRVYPDQLVNWGWKGGKINLRLKSYIQKIHATKKNYSGSELASLKKDVEILGAAVAVLINQEKPRRKISAVEIVREIELHADRFWSDKSLPKGDRAVKDLLRKHIGKL